MNKLTAKDLTAQEKLRLLLGVGAWDLYDAEGKLPRFTMSDGPVGLRRVLSVREDGSEEMKPSVAYPAIAVLANTWDRALARKMGEALASDCLENGVDLLLAPGVNIKRDPRNGRNFEYFSEDPYLAGVMAREYVDGLQQSGVGACVKHFCANNLEYDRFEQSSEVDERTLYEIYYKPFSIVCEAKPVSLMCSYNRVNGQYAAENKRGFAALRGELGFDGAIFSDWEAVHDRTRSAKAGLDIEMPFNEAHFGQLVKDYESGVLSDEELDACAQRVIDLIYRCKEMHEGKRAPLTVEERLSVAEKIEREGAVLLKNEGILPLKKGTRAAVAGCYAKAEPTSLVFGGGSARMVWLGQPFDLAALLSERLGEQTVYERAFLPKVAIGNAALGIPARAVENAALADVSIVCAGTGADLEYESGDRESIRLPEVQERAIVDIAKANPETVVVLFAGSAVDVSAWEPYVKGILLAGFCGERGGAAVADLLCGLACPSGRLAETFPCALEDVPAANTFRNANVTRYSEGLDVGYRYFVGAGRPDHNPFAFGLSYAVFEYSGLRVQTDGDTLELSYLVRNTSQTDGKEVSQVYVRPIAAKVYRPERELKGWSKDEVAAGGQVRVTVRLGRDAFSYWSAAEARERVDDGVYEVIVGKNCTDARLRCKVCIRGGNIVLP